MSGSLLILQEHFSYFFQNFPTYLKSFISLFVLVTTAKYVRNFYYYEHFIACPTGLQCPTPRAYEGPICYMIQVLYMIVHPGVCNICIKGTIPAFDLLTNVYVYPKESSEIIRFIRINNHVWQLRHASGPYMNILSNIWGKNYFYSYPDVMMPAYNKNKFAVFFFVTYIAVALYFFMNLVRFLWKILSLLYQ